MDMLAGAAPNLREVDLYSKNTRWHSFAPTHQRGSRPPTPSSGVGTLRHLGIHIREQLCALIKHGRVTDFSRLESLEIHDAVGVKMPQRLATYHLPALEHVSFNMTDLRLDGESADEAVASIHGAVANLVLSLPAL
jgi:hypothetical protein